MSREQARREQRHKKVGAIFKIAFGFILVSSVAGTVGAAGVFFYFSRDLPQIITAADYWPLGVSRILGAGGRDEVILAEFFKERRYLVPFDKVPETVIHAFVAAEDDEFFEHNGVNLVSILRASIANFRAGQVVQGGSTITQQVAKSLLLSPEKSYVRKIREVILANRIEKNLTKQQILYLYLNQIYLGHGAYGVQAAARAYFRKDVSQLNLAEATLLAGLPQAPGKYSPHLNPKRAKERQLYVLRRMYENKRISQSQMSEGAVEVIKIYDDPPKAAAADYYVEHVRRYLLEKYGEKAIYEDGLTVAVPATVELARVAATGLQEGLRAIDKRIGFRGPIRQIKAPDEIERFLKNQRRDLIRSKLGFQVLTPDGRIDPFEGMRLSGIEDDTGLLDIGGIYPAVITSFDLRRKSFGALLGGSRIEIPFDDARWATPSKDDKVLGKLLSKGDVVSVKVKAIEGGTVLCALDQHPQLQGALFSMDITNGSVLAMEGGYDFKHSEFNRAAQALRQPGSAFKPIIFSAALERGFTPASVIVDSPIVYEDEERGKWKPSNFEEKFYGDTPFRMALIKSRNIPTIKIVQAIQVGQLIEYMKRIGLNGQFTADLSISLGSGSVSLMELTRAYGLFPRLGRVIRPGFINWVRDRDGKVLEENKGDLLPPTAKIPTGPIDPAPTPQESPMVVESAHAEPKATPKVPFAKLPPPDDADQVMDPRVAYVMTHLMKEVVAYGTGYEAKNLGRPAAGKTGTTNDYLDAWFVGFTPQVVTGVWVGFDDQKSIGLQETGAKAALPIWLTFMKEAVKKYPEVDFSIPAGVVFATLDSKTAKTVASNAAGAIREAFIEGTEPTEFSGSDSSSSQSQSDFLKDDFD